mgnify:CR=1 FL=1
MQGGTSPHPQTLLKQLQDIIHIDPGQRGLNRNPQRNLFTATATDLASACQSLAHHSAPRLAIMTGFFIPTGDPPGHETDGPLGALFLLRACAALGIPALIAIDPPGVSAVRAGLQHCALPLDRIRELPRPTVTDWNRDPSYLLGFSPTHYVFIERAGPNAEGRCLTMRGVDITEHMAPVHRWIDNLARGTANAFPAVTIGIGDGGNEIGMGKIDPAILADNIPWGTQIQCRIATDHLIVAGVSNWGSYALAAGLFLLRGQMPPVQLFDPQAEHDLLEIMVREGPLVDGVTGRPSVSVDGLPWETYIEPLVRMREVLLW